MAKLTIKKKVLKYTLKMVGVVPIVTHYIWEAELTKTCKLTEYDKELASAQH